MDTFSGGRSYLTDNFDEAFVEARKIIDDDPMDLDGAYIMSCLLDDVYDNYVEAEKILRNIFEKGTTTGVLLNNLAYTLILEGKLGEARNYLGVCPSNGWITGN